MKKYIMLIIIIMAIGYMTACGTDNVDDIDYKVDIDYEAKEECANELLPNVATDPGLLSSAQAIEDVNQMLNVLRENFPFFDIAYVELGVDIESLALEAKNMLDSIEHITIADFYLLLENSFRPLWGVGHFAIHHPHTDFTDGEWVRPIRDENELDSFEDVLSFLGWDDSPNSGNNQNLRRLLWDIRLYYPKEIYNVIVQGIEERDLDALMEAFWLIHLRTNVVADIIEEGNIAYLAIRSMAPFMRDIAIRDDELLMLSEFYNSIENFEHIIIDIRGNDGGSGIMFDRLVFAPLTESNDDMTVDAIIFYFAGDYVMERLDIVPMNFGGMKIVDTKPLSMDIFLQEFYLPELNQQNVQRADYALRVQFLPNTIPHPMIDINFSGKVWLLTDEFNYSASHMAAWISQEAGFATLVGEPTSGGFGGFPDRVNGAMENSRMQFQFDHTGILNSRGGVIEGGIIPDHFNREGMCALETTLALIAEGAY